LSSAVKLVVESIYQVWDKKFRIILVNLLFLEKKDCFLIYYIIFAIVFNCVFFKELYKLVNCKKSWVVAIWGGVEIGIGVVDWDWLESMPL